MAATSATAAVASMRMAIVVFDGFDELDAFITLGLLNQLGARGVKAELASPMSHVTSMSGVTVQAQQPLSFANEADAVVFASGTYNRAIAEDIGTHDALLDRFQLDPLRQLIGAQCAGTLLLARLGLLADMPACTDATSKPWMVQAGVRVVEEPFHARGPVATAGGSLAAHYLATWLMVHAAGIEATRKALRSAAPVGQEDDWADRLLSQVTPFLTV